MSKKNEKMADGSNQPAFQEMVNLSAHNKGFW